MVQNYAPGLLEVKKYAFWILLFLIVTQLLGFLARTRKLSQLITLDEDWRNTFGILMSPLGAGPGVVPPGVVAPEGPKSILYKHSHVAYQIKGNEE